MSVTMAMAPGRNDLLAQKSGACFALRIATCVQHEDGRPDFAALRRAIKGGPERMTYYALDLPTCGNRQGLHLRSVTPTLAQARWVQVMMVNEQKPV